MHEQNRTGRRQRALGEWRWRVTVAGLRAVRVASRSEAENVGSSCYNDREWYVRGDQSRLVCACAAAAAVLGAGRSSSLS